MRLNSHTLSSKVFASYNNLVNGVLCLGCGSALEKGIEAHGTSVFNAIHIVQFDQIEDLLRVSRPRGPADEFGQPAVKRLLSSLEAGASGPTRTRLLSPHAESAGSALPSRDATSLAVLAFAAAGSGTKVIEGEFLLMDG